VNSAPNGDAKSLARILGSRVDAPQRSKSRFQIFLAEGRVVGMHRNIGTRAGKTLDVNCWITFHIKEGRATAGREYFYNLYAWDEFWS